MITVMVAALNEEARLEGTIINLVKSAKQAGSVLLDIVVVDDGSTDRTPQVIKRLEKRYPFVRSIHHAKNMGIGTGLREVITIAKYSKFMLIPGDNLVAPSLIKKLFVNRNKAELVISYQLNKEIRTVLRNILSDLYGLIYMATFNVWIQYLNSVCIYPTRKLQKIDIKSSRFSICAEMTIKLLRLGCTFYELPGVYMKVGLPGSTSISFKNLIEIFSTYLRMIYEIKIVNNHMYKYCPKRVDD